MVLVVYAFGSVLILAGAIAILMGAPIVHLEQGWSMVIAGAVAASAGCVILVMGLVVAQLRELRRLLAVGAPVRAPIAPPPLVAVEEGDASEAVPDAEAEPVHATIEPPPARPAPASLPPADRVAAEPRMDILSARRDPAPEPAREPMLDDEATETPETNAPTVDPIQPPPPLAPSLPRRRPGVMAASLVRRLVQNARPKPRPPAQEPGVQALVPPLDDLTATDAPARTAIDLSSGWPDRAPWTRAEASGPTGAAPDETDWEEPLDAPAADHHAAASHRDEPIDETVHEPEPTPDERHLPAIDVDETSRWLPPEPPAVEPTVVGRYTAGSASYVMYSNGMIEVETDTGIHQFASMQELKAFIEQQDGAKV